MMSTAARLKLLPDFRVASYTMTGPPVNPQLPQMNAPTYYRDNVQLSQSLTPPDDDNPDEFILESWSHTSGKWTATPGWKAGRIPFQIYHSPCHYAEDARKLLQNWQTLAEDGFWRNVNPSVSTRKSLPDMETVAREFEVTVPSWWKLMDPPRTLPPGTSKYWQLHKAAVLNNMREVIVKATLTFEHPEVSITTANLSIWNYLQLTDAVVIPNKQVEMVGSIPKDFDIPFMESETSAIAASAVALGVFSREQLKDDRRGSIRKHIEEQYGHPASRAQLRQGVFDVFSIAGLLDGPWFPEHSAKALLSEIAKYAQTEQKIVAVPKEAYARGGVTDLTEYYVRLGFEKVWMEDDSFNLVYIGSTPSGEGALADKGQLMVRMKLWSTDDEAKAFRQKFPSIRRSLIFSERG